MPGAANGGGGAMYISSFSLSNFSVINCEFNACNISVFSGSTGKHSNSSGGAISLELSRSNYSAVAISSCTFFKCSASGANIANLAVRGGGIAVSRAAAVSLKHLNFINCSVANAVTSEQSTNVVVSGGAGASLAQIQNVTIVHCVFNSAGSRDSSGTSTGLLILASSLFRTHIAVSSTELKSSSTVLRVQCVNNDGVYLAECLPMPPHISVTNSFLYQLRPSNDVTDDGDNFNVSGGSLMSVQSAFGQTFSQFRMRCALEEFAAFKTSSNLASASFVDYSCKPCQPFYISASGNEVMLERMMSATNVHSCLPVSATSKLKCPFGVERCQTYAYMTKGFWTDFSESGVLNAAVRCPHGYCGCAADSCLLTPLLSTNSSDNHLCRNNRRGKLCGGCAPNFTQSLDGKSCISNEDCAKSRGWVWTLLIIISSCVGFFIIPTREYGSGTVACFALYLQVASFAQRHDDGSTDLISILAIFLGESTVSIFSSTCYALSLSAYHVTAMSLFPCLLVVIFAIFWTWMLRLLEPRLLLRNIQLKVSYSGTLSIAMLFIFSRVSSVLFSLVHCTSYAGDGSGVLFIDGTQPCMDSKWGILVACVVILCMFPVAFTATLFLKKLPESAQAVVCRAFTPPMFFWGALSLQFRLLISLSQFLDNDYPHLVAFLRMCLSILMLFFVTNFRPYKSPRTFWLDVVCYACLTALFGLQLMEKALEYVGFDVKGTDEQAFFDRMKTLSAVFRYASSNISLYMQLLPFIFARYMSHLILCRHIPVVLFIFVWLKNRFILKNIPKEVCRQIHRVKLLFFGRKQRNVDEHLDGQSITMKTKSQFRQQRDELI
jgi:hypothetical protein